MRGVFVISSAIALVANADEQPLWTGPADANAVRAETIVIEGTPGASGFTARTAHVPDAQPATAPALAAIGDDLLPAMRVRAFGIEERVTIRRDAAGVRIACAPGARTAGAVLTFDARLPRRMRGTLAIAGRGGAGWGASLTPPGGDAPAAAQATFGRRGARLPLPGAARRDLVLVCPRAASEATLDAIRIVPRAGDVRPTGTWVWSEDSWRADPAGFARRVADAGLDEIALMLRLDGASIAARDALVTLARALERRGIRWRVVEGDPSMATGQGLPAAVARTRVLRAEIEALGLRPATLELDIEPRGLPEYGADPAAAWARWAVAVEALAGAWGDPVELDVPWWMLGAPGGEAAVARAAPHTAALVVMAYRTDADEILAAAEPWLALGAARDTPVRIAIESGAVAAEIHRTYRRAELGELIADDGNGQAMLALYDRPVAAGEAAAFRFSHETRVDPRRISFCGDEQRRRAAEARVRPVLAAWPSFAGLRIHGLFAAGGCA